MNAYFPYTLYVHNAAELVETYNSANPAELVHIGNVYVTENPDYDYVILVEDDGDANAVLDAYVEAVA